LFFLRIALHRRKGKEKAKNMADLQPICPSTWTWTIALDGGTTNTRARLMQGDRIIATARRRVGVRDTLLADPARSGASPPAADLASTPGQPHRARLIQAVREVVDEVSRADVLSAVTGRAAHNAGAQIEAIVAAGMLSSEIGLVAVPHVEAPAGLEDLARGVAIGRFPAIVERPIYFVPGVRTAAADGPDGWFQADLMRGEECETLGAYAALRARAELEIDRWQVFLWPGSHTKLVEVDPSGRITRSQTSLAGELLQTLARHTLLAASLPETLPDEVDHDIAAAAARAVETQGLGRAAFLVRIAAVAQIFNPIERASFWIGAVVADDVNNLARHPILMPGRPVWVGGRQPLRSLYAARLVERHAGIVVPLDESLAESASAWGAMQIAGRRFQFDGPLDHPVVDQPIPDQPD
jgi:2-dehydro-3-deoxygalactonokinase